MSGRGRWSPGEDHGLVWSGGVAILDGSVDADVAERLWGLLDDGCDLAGFLDELSRASGAGLLSIPGFAIGLITEGQGFLAARGDFAAIATTAAGADHIDGSGVSTWSERRVDDVAGLVVSRLGREPGPGRLLLAGIVPAESLTWGGASVARPQRRAPLAPSADTPAKARSIDLRKAVVPAGESPAIAEAIAPKDTSPVVAGATVSDEPLDQPVSDDRFDFLWGDTQARPVEGAAVRAEPEESVEPEPVVAEPVPPPVAMTDQVAAAVDDLGPSPATETRWPTMDDVRPRPEPESTDFISGVPQRYPPPPEFDPYAVPRPGMARFGAPGPGGHPPEPDGDHDGETIARGSLPTAIDLGGDPGAGAILAIFCDLGHPNPPQRSTCRVCHRAIDGIPVRIPQPAIGRLICSTGEEFDLDRSVIAGRAPRTARVNGAELPRLLALPYAHISGSHLEIQVDGWTVLARDLDSTNGTFLRRGDESPKRVLGAPMPLFQGDVLDFGDGVRITFEDLG